MKSFFSKIFFTFLLLFFNISNVLASHLPKEDTYTIGNRIYIPVNVYEVLPFYVLEDDGTTITAILDHNLGDNVAWCAKEEQDVFNQEQKISCLSNGWTFRREFLERTESWDHISVIRILSAQEFADFNRDTTWFNDGTKLDQLARPVQMEFLASNLKCQSLECKTNSTNGYWMADYSVSFGELETQLQNRWAVTVQDQESVFQPMNVEVALGIRPVIEISKAKLLSLSTQEKQLKPFDSSIDSNEVEEKVEERPSVSSFRYDVLGIFLFLFLLALIFSVAFYRSKRRNR